MVSRRLVLPTAAVWILEIRACSLHRLGNGTVVPELETGPNDQDLWVAAHAVQVFCVAASHKTAVSPSAACRAHKHLDTTDMLPIYQELKNSGHGQAVLEASSLLLAQHAEDEVGYDRLDCVMVTPRWMLSTTADSPHSTPKWFTMGRLYRSYPRAATLFWRRRHIGPNSGSSGSSQSSQSG